MSQSSLIWKLLLKLIKSFFSNPTSALFMQDFLMTYMHKHFQPPKVILLKKHPKIIFELRCCLELSFSSVTQRWCHWNGNLKSLKSSFFSWLYLFWFKWRNTCSVVMYWKMMLSRIEASNIHHEKKFVVFLFLRPLHSLYLPICHVRLCFHTSLNNVFSFICCFIYTHVKRVR